MGPIEHRPMPMVSFDASRMGPQKPLDARLVERNFATITNSQLPRVESSKYGQPYDNMNILERYNNRSMDMDTDMFTAEVMNERGADVLAIFAPIVPMTEHHVSFQTREYFMLPFDLTAIGGVPRKTYWHQDARRESLFHYARYQAMELNYLMDVHFGRQMLNDTLGVLVAQARLTLFFQFSVGVVASAITQSYKRFQNDSRSALQIHYELAYFALPHSNPDDFALKMLQLREPQTLFDAILVAENTGPRYREIARESRSVNGYHYGYNEETGRFMVALFEARKGVAAIGTADGGAMVIVENPSYRYQNIKDERVAPTQTLEGVSNLCEVVLQPPIHADDDYPGLPGHNDPVTYDQTETSISHQALEFANALSACGLWNDRDGEVRGGGPSEVMEDMAKDYNRDTDFKNWLQATIVDNNTPDRKSYNTSTDLQDTDFRGKFPFFTIKNGKVVPAECILDLPERAVPMRFIEKIGRFIYSKYKTNLAQMDWSIEDHKREVRAYVRTFFPDGGLYAVAPTFERGTPIVLNTKLYGARGASSSSENMLMHLPDDSHATYAKTLSAIDTETARASTDEERRAIENGKQAIFAALRQGSGTTTAVSVLNDVATALEGGKSVASFASGKLITSRMKSSETKLPASAMAKANDMHDNSGDAMDIDGGSFGARNAPPNFTLFDETRAGSFPIYTARKNTIFSKVSGNDAYKLILTEIGMSYFSLGNVENLARRYGMQLFRMNYWRPFQRYRMLHMVATVRGPSTMITGFASPLVHPSMQGMEGYINIIAQFFSATIVTQPRNIRFIPNVFANGMLSDINTNFVRSTYDFENESPHKPSTIPVPVPMDESVYTFPQHMFNYDLMHPRDRNARSPLAKHSGADLIRARIGDEKTEYLLAASYTPDPMNAMPLSVVGHRSWCLHHDLGTGRYVNKPGTSPRGQAKHNSIQAAQVWAGASVRFADQGGFTVAIA